jgi:hypothetical protein
MALLRRPRMIVVIVRRATQMLVRSPLSLHDAMEEGG